MDLIDIIRDKLKKERVKMTTLALKTELPIHTIGNILKKNSKRYDYILKIMTALNIPFSVDCINCDSIEIKDMASYLEAHIIINNIIKKINKNNITIHKKDLEDIIYKLYIYMLNNPSQKSLHNAYAEGLINPFS